MNSKALIAWAGGAMPATLDAPTDYVRPLRVGMAVIAIGFGGFGTWAAVAPLSSAVISQGVLVVASKKKTVQHLEGGIVKQILVKDGDAVAAGQVLVRLDDSRAVTNLAMAESNLWSARALESRLLAEREGQDAVRFPVDLLARDDADTRAILTTQLSQFDERRRSLDGQRDILEQRVGQLQSEIDGYRVQRESKQRQIVLLNQELTGVRKLAAKGWYAINRVRAMERDMAALEGQMGADDANMARSDKGIGETRMQILQLTQKQREEVAAQLRDVQNQLTDLTERAVAARDVVARLDVVAPVDGTVQGVKVATVGGIIGAGGELLDIVPLGDRLVVEAQIAPHDIETVAAGQDAEIRFPALNSRATPSVRGHVATVSADRVTDPHTQQPFYVARIEVAKAELDAKLDGHRLQAGMPAEVMLQGPERTALGYMTKPFLDSFARSFRER